MGKITRVGYHDFKTYAERLKSGMYQGLVHAVHHLLVGSVQTVFRAGPPTMDEAEAIANAEARMAELICLVTGRETERSLVSEQTVKAERPEDWPGRT